MGSRRFLPARRTSLHRGLRIEPALGITENGRLVILRGAGTGAPDIQVQVTMTEEYAHCS